MQQVPAELCYSQPYNYRFCDKDYCIPVDDSCPCQKHLEFQCILGNCIPVEFICDGLKQCLYGEDEKSCSLDQQGKEVSGIEKQTLAFTEATTVSVGTSKETPLTIPVVVTISSVCVFVCVLLIVLLCIFISRRQKNNTSRESQSATEPLRKSYITSDLEAADSSSENREKYRQTGFTCTYRNHELPERIHYIPIEAADNAEDYRISHHQTEKVENEANEEEPRSEVGDSGDDKCRKNMAINPGVEIYNINPADSSKFSGLGKYTFKPRLKYMTSKPYFEIEEKDREKLYVINSYKHCSGKSILPSTLTFDKDPEKFSNKFATDLLCSSTPRPGTKHLLKKEKSRSEESLTGQPDNDLDL